MAWWVVVGHSMQLTGLSYRNVDGGGVLYYLMVLLERGFTAVNTFIIVSGFVITHLLLVKRETYFLYIKRRWLRVYPIFIISLFVAILVQPLYLEAYTTYPWVYAGEMRLDRVLEEQNNYLYHMVLHLTLMHGIVPEEILKFSSSTFLAPAWSLSLEWQFYLIAPVLIFGLINRGRWKFFWIVIILCLLIFFFKEQNAYSWKYSSILILGLPHFLIGIGCRFLFEENRLAKIKGFSMVAAGFLFVDYLALLIWMVFLLIALYENGSIHFPKYLALIARFLALNKFTVTLGTLSYSTYLLHIPVFSLIVGGCSVFVGGGLSQYAVVALVSLSILVMFPLSYLSYKWIELPFVRFGKN